MLKLRVLLSGATGFVGGKVLRSLGAFNVNVLGRSKPELVNSDNFFQSKINSSTDYSIALNNVDLVIHCAARAHVMNDNVSDPLAEFRSVNTAGTLNLARQAAESGIKRFIFISSIKVNGEATTTSPYTADDDFVPTDPYGLSKYEAEQGLLQLAKETGMEVVIIRPTLVYGPGVKANFLSLINLVRKRIPLPFGAVNNKRSLVAIDNLVDLIVTCIDHPNAANETFLVSDDDDVSTTELLKRIGVAFGISPFLIPVPRWAMNFPASIIRKKTVVDRLYGSLQVDITYTKERLNWTPPVTMSQQLTKIAASFNSK